MSIHLSDKNILVTGAAGGIGRAICQALTAAGARVVATDLVADGAGIECTRYVQHDVSSAEAWAAVAESVASTEARLDALVNNAAISVVASIEATTLEQWREVQSVNVESVLLGTQAMLPLLKAAAKTNAAGASIVNFSSVGGLRGAAFNAAYCASKTAIKNFSKSAAHEFGALGYNIRVNSVHPGGVDTPMLRSIIGAYVDLGAAPSFEAAEQGVKARHALGRLATPEDIAGGVTYLCSDAASFVTGSELVIDGGFTCF